MEKGLDIPLAERLSLFSFYSLSFLMHTNTHAHTHPHIYISIYILAAKNARQFEIKNTPLNGERCPSFGTLKGLVCELYAQYQVAILYFCTEKYLF